jgi:adenylate cyclase
MTMRRLAAVLVADVVGFSAQMERDDAGTLARLRLVRADVLDPAIAENGGRIVKTTGDGVLAEFGSADGALRCAVGAQRALAARNAKLPAHERVELRIGINLGDVIVEDDDIFGDGVNVAARLESIAAPGGICIAAAVRDQVHGNLDIAFVDAGEQRMKNIARPIRAYAVDLGGAKPSPAPAVAVKLRAMSLGVLPLHETGDGRTGRAVTRELTAMLVRSSSLISVVPVPPALVSSALDAPDAIGRAAGVRYLIEGDLRANGDGIAIHAHLIDAATGEQAWSESAPLPEDATQRARALHAIAWHSSRAMISAEIRRVLGDPGASMPVDGVIRALAVDRTESDPHVRLREKQRVLEDALAREPNLVPGLIGLAIVLDQSLDFDVDVDLAAIGRRMDELTAKAVRLNDMQPATWFLRSAALMTSGQWQAALEACMKAIRLEPFSSMLVLHHAAVTAMSGKPQQALSLVEQAVAMDPQGSAAHMSIASMIHLLLGDSEAAISAGEKAIALGGADHPDNHLYLSAAYAQVGDMAKAQAARDALVRLVPGFTIGKYRWRSPVAHPAWLALAQQHLHPGLRKAGFVD